MQIKRGCDARRLALVDDLHRALRRSQGIEAEHDALPAQRRVDLVEMVVQAHRARLGDAPHGLEQEQVVEIDLRPGMPDALAAVHPFLQRRQVVKSAVGCLVTCCGAGNVAALQNALISQGRSRNLRNIPSLLGVSE